MRKIEKIKNMRAEVEEYFKDDLEAIEEELKKSKEYSEIIDREIEKLKAPSLGVNKGAQHYLIEHINNAVQLQTQRQGLRKDRVAIKKNILDYSSKFLDEEVETEDEMKLILEKLIRDKEKKSPVENEMNMDNEIDKILDNNIE